MSTAARLRWRSGLTYAALVAGLLPAWPAVNLAGTAAALVAVTLAWGELRMVARGLLTLVLLSLLAALLVAPHSLVLAATAMIRLTALIVIMMLLAAVLGRSPDLKRISAGLFSGRPLPRYYSITFGTAFLSVPLNFGSVGLIGSMVDQQVRSHGDSAMARNAARGVLRGYGASPMFSPLSISVVTTLTYLVGLHSWELLAISVPLAMIYLASGALFREAEKPVGGDDRKDSMLMPWLRFGAVVTAIWMVTLLFNGLLDLRYSKAVTLSCLIAVILLMVRERWRGERVSLPTMAPLANEVVIMGGSSFLGALISLLVLHSLGEAFSLPDWGYPLVAFVVPFLFFGGGQLGLNPIIMGTLAGGVMGPVWPPEAYVGLGLAIVSGWAQCATGTPYSANSLLMERLTGYDARVAAFRWNLGLSACWLVLSGGLAALLTVVLMP
ncbi:hypothetical protein [Alloalcanivorax xenomutans]|uniref:Uncharacterized protein n=1 Tax=Alloalcanivorax xenomutans TaxID=1094342 RepID=A0A9Q3W2G2_9GAMM|nr:hypothetical protein [Alloalcanivorax xenomutans]ERS09501.1 hypothetical protein Q668_05165 [Alcanivorax sp. PN-3]PHS71733.1 MAG: hypothetical protein COB00_02455 [Alcanivorax sp.]ARB44022.1 hypothetical protein P40_00235 [Alloalcanivorax xenomutans]MCE7507370.1 hypothetical protein [Alloalcanivorax xenomutans]MCE7522837.1 hypothetical protein [Alloalcanivorax xenomutans]